MATPESGAQMRTRYSTVKTVPAAATRYTTTATFASWRSPKSCSVTLRQCAACHRNSVITPRKHSLPNHAMRKLGSASASPMALRSPAPSTDDGNVCFYDFHVSLSITEVMALDIRFPRWHLNAKPLHIS